MNTQPGIAVYSPLILSIYDLWVLKITNKFAWKCHVNKILKFTEENVSSTHLDIGVGTGYYFHQGHFPKLKTLALMDLNSNSLQFCQKRLKKYTPQLFKCDVYKPQPHIGEKFSSVSMNFLFHCLPGTLKEKAVLFDNLKDFANIECVWFGTSILSTPVNHNLFGKLLLKIYNHKGIFSNINDSYEDLKSELESRFENVEIQIVGCVALFKVSKRK